MDFSELTPAERMIAEQAVLNLRSLNKTCDEAADGTVIAVAETIAVEQGRKLIRKTMQCAVDAQAETLEKKLRPPGSAPAESESLTTDAKPAD